MLVSRPCTALDDRYRRIRATTEALCRTLEPEDYVVQTAPHVSPTKWHLAHVTWFFEQFLLVPRQAGYRAFHPRYDYLFNSYYETKGCMHPRAERGLLSRPTVREVMDYRAHVDAAMLALLDEADDDEELAFHTELGLNHEQQHQELMLTDIKQVFFASPLEPALADIPPAPRRGPLPPLGFRGFSGGTPSIGAAGSDFCFDNETPRHRVLVDDFELADRPISNGEYRAFIDAGGYADPSLWLADGWAWINAYGVDRPLYWNADRDSEFTLAGRRDIDPDAPVSHVSFYEADAFARWAGMRLPSEAEWEVAATGESVDGNLLDTGALHPRRDATTGAGLRQLFGDVWEWTASPYSPYPGFEPLAGSLGEYNGKFMCNQMVCRGGSCATPSDHVRASYRNFFYPHERWQFFGIRLARSPESG